MVENDGIQRTNPEFLRISGKGYEKCRRDNEEERACSQAGTAQEWVPG